MNIAIIASAKDPAGINIRNNLLELYDFRKSDEKFDDNEVFELTEELQKIKVYLINEEQIFADDIDKKIRADIFVFASKHRSSQGKPSFSVHSIGNWGKAEHGGKEKTLCISYPMLIKNFFLEINNLGKETGHALAIEATHHGPYIGKPVIFVEIGSTEKEWPVKSYGEIIAKTIMNGLRNKKDDYKIAIGLGGTHYCSNFNKITLNTDIAFSHVCSKYALENLDKAMITQAIRKTLGKVDFFVLDWKGMGKEKQRIIDLLKEMDLEFKRSDKI